MKLALLALLLTAACGGPAFTAAPDEVQTVGVSDVATDGGDPGTRVPGDPPSSSATAAPDAAPSAADDADAPVATDDAQAPPEPDSGPTSAQPDTGADACVPTNIVDACVHACALTVTDGCGGTYTCPACPPPSSCDPALCPLCAVGPACCGAQGNADACGCTITGFCASS